MSELRTNRIVPRDGLPSGSSGGIIQIRQSSLTAGNVSSTVWQTTSTSYVDVFSGTITPTRNDSKIFVQMALAPYAGNTGTLRMAGQVLRGSTQVWYSSDVFYRSGGTIKALQSAIAFLDSPATTSTVTYKFQVKITSNNNSTGEFNVDSSNYNNNMILMEVAG